MSNRIAAAPRHRHRHRRWVGAGVLVLLISGLLLGLLLWRSVFDAATDRTPNELIRHLEKRLQGHTRLEHVLLPPLHLAQRQLERSPPPALPALGKGQQTTGSSASTDGFARDLLVDTPQAIREALLQALPGTRIVVAPGLYPFDRTLRLGSGGAHDAPLSLTARQAGTVLFEFSQTEGVLVDKPHWRFENLVIHGVCDHHDTCEHAFHVVGKASHTSLHNNRIVDFNAHIKVNGLRGDWPDHGRLTSSTLTNMDARNTARPVVMLDLVGASHWGVYDNLVSHFVKAAGNRVAYGMFMKGAGEHGRFERNLVICTSRDVSQPGARVGISFGGGGTNPAVCRQDRCEAFEHRYGLAMNNIVGHCNDAGMDVNGGVAIQLLHNTLINTSGISSRGLKSQTHAYGNLLDAGVKARDGGQLSGEFNLALHGLYASADADELLFSRPIGKRPIPSHPANPQDFFGRARPALSAPGAVVH